MLIYAFFYKWNHSLFCFSLGYHLSISQALPHAVRCINRKDYLNTKRADWNKALVDSSVNIFTLLHILYNSLLIIDELWARLGSAIQAKNCGQNKFLGPGVCLHRPEPLFSCSFIVRIQNTISVFIPSWTWEFLLFQVMNLIPISLASTFREFQICPTIFDF